MATGETSSGRLAAALAIATCSVPSDPLAVRAEAAAVHLVRERADHRFAVVLVGHGAEDLPERSVWRCGRFAELGLHVAHAGRDVGCVELPVDEPRRVERVPSFFSTRSSRR